eukprot:7450695-Alexandrium_andersonii.AAC.1
MALTSVARLIAQLNDVFTKAEVTPSGAQGEPSKASQTSAGASISIKTWETEDSYGQIGWTMRWAQTGLMPARPQILLATD